MSHQAVIRIEVETGKVLSWDGADQDRKNEGVGENKAIQLTPAEQEKLEYLAQSGKVSWAATAVKTQLNPHCVIIWIGGTPYKICFPHP